MGKNSRAAQDRFSPSVQAFARTQRQREATFAHDTDRRGDEQQAIVRPAQEHALEQEGQAVTTLLQHAAPG